MHNDEQLAAKYKQITDDNLHRRGHEFDDIGAHLANELYSDRTHFIYELLQNAEDALARRSASQPGSIFSHSVDFRLFPDCLEMRHFGQPFDDRDIASISDVFKSTKKADDFTQIGKKGISFKSVYAFTHLPEVHSGPERFQIERFIRLKLAVPRPLADGQTLFILPLVGDEQERQEKFRQIRERLKNLDLRPLLFLRHIHEITWGIEDESKGCYQPTYEDEGWARRVTVVTQRSGSTAPTDWLVFQRPVKLVESCSTLTVEIAFRLDTPSKDGVQDIVPVPESESQLLVYFPTKRTTHCGFLIQGPFKTIANREDIHQSDDWNRRLIEEVAELVIDTLHRLRDRGLLTVGVLKAMSLNALHFQKGSIFQPIYGKVREALYEQPLLPTDDGGFVPGKYAKLARGEELLDLMSPPQLRLWLATSSSVYGKPEYEEALQQRGLLPIEMPPYNWLDRRITEAQTRDLYQYLVGWESRWLDFAIESLVKNIEVRPETVIRRLTPDFLESQTDEWLTNFYKFMLEHKDLWEVVKYRPIIRLEHTLPTDRPNHVAPFRKEGGVDIPNAYLPGAVDSDLPLVKKTLLADDKSKKFLVELGLTEPNLVAEVLQEVLPKYASQAPILSEEEHRQDLKKIFAALHTDSQVERKRVLDRLRETAFLRAVNAATKESAFSIPGTLYVRSPELTCYFEGNRDAWFLDENEAIEDIRTALGIARTIRVKRREPDPHGYVHLETLRGYHKRGVDRFDPSIHIDGLEHALTHKPSREKAVFIWNQLLLPNSDCLYGTIESCSRQTFVGAKRESQWSKIGVLGTEQAWLPHPDGGFSEPQALSLDDLPSEFSKHETVTKLLGMRSSSMTTLAQGLGIAPAVIEFFQQNKDALRDFEEFKKWREEREKPKKPEREPHNQERRRQQVAQAARNAPSVTSEVRPRSERSSWEEQREARTYLREEYTNEDKELICQICGEEMPFKLDDGSYYFEAIECVRGTGKELLWNHLALCPVCAAKYRHANSIQPEEIKRRVLAALATEMPITLAREEKTIWFTKVHLLDLQTALHEV